MIRLPQALWDQMRAELAIDALPQIRDACQALLNGSLGPLTEEQIADLQSVERSVSKLTRRVEGEPIDWADDSAASHALRGPLNSTIGFSRLMLKGMGGPINEAQREALETIYTTGRRLLNLFNLLLDALLLYRGEINFDMEAVCVDGILRELVAAGNTMAGSGGFTFETDVKAPVAETVIQSDAKRLRQALMALLTATVPREDQGRVTLRARLGEDALLIQFEDWGGQLPPQLPANLPHLLTAQADLSLPYDVHLRIGLAWHLLTRMGGRLEVRQTGGTGTLLATLPLA